MPSITEQDNRDALARTIGMLKRGEGFNTRYRVLFYGQSITSPKWTEPAAQELQRHYPGVRFTFRNMAIGGHAAHLLKRTVARDIDDFYPDLVVLHVYGGAKDYDEVVRTIRSRSAAEVILQTDHLQHPVEPVCPVGLNLRFTTPPGCVGTVWLHQHDWDNQMSGVIIPRTAARYRTAIDPRRTAWAAYLSDHGLQPSDLLADGVHPNATGWRLAAGLFTRFLERTVDRSPVRTQDLVRILPYDARTGGALKLDGNRFELVTSRPLDGRFGAAIDGVPSTDIEGCWTVSRTTPVPWIPDWPMLRQVRIQGGTLAADDWQAEIFDIGPDLSTFRFRLTSRLNGDEGEGKAGEDFTSRSGTVTIAAQDWALPSATASKPAVMPRTLIARWSRRYRCGFQPDRASRVAPAEYHYVLGTGLRNATHEVTVRLPPEARPFVKGMMAFRPAVNDG